DCDAAGFGGDMLGRLAVVDHKRGPLDQISRRIATHGKLGENNETGIPRPGTLREFDHLRRIPAKVAYGWVDLPERNLHRISVTGRDSSRQAMGIPGEEGEIGAKSQLGVPATRICALWRFCSYMRASARPSRVSRSESWVASPETIPML